jgi:radical SAM protein with 4Fe4S-binding SPASM domain
LLRSWHSLLWLLSLNNWRFLIFCEAKHLVALAATNANAAANDEWHQDENEKESGSCSSCSGDSFCNGGSSSFSFVLKNV